MEGIFASPPSVYSRLSQRKGDQNFHTAPVIPMMRLDTANKRDWQGFTRILEVMTLLDEIEAGSEEDIQDAVEGFCEIPTNPGQTMSMEEVVFWAGVATGMEYARSADEGNMDPATADKVLVFSSVFAHSIKNAIVDLALGELEPEGQQGSERLGTRMSR
jgi:hypothetical protein